MGRVVLSCVPLHEGYGLKAKATAQGEGKCVHDDTREAIRICPFTLEVAALTGK